MTIEGWKTNVFSQSLKYPVFDFDHYRGVFSTGAMGALAPAILKNRLLATTIFGQFITVGKIEGAK